MQQSTVFSIQHPEFSLSLSESVSDHELTNSFLSFFIDKVEKIRSNVNSDNSAVFEEANAYQSDQIMSEFQALSCEDVRKIIMRFPSKSCSLDSLPTWILKEILYVLLPFITNIVNSSLISGVSRDFKASHNHTCAKEDQPGSKYVEALKTCV